MATYEAYSDPTKLTIAKLKSLISMYGFGDRMPADRDEKKAFYVDLYNRHVVPVIQDRNKRSTERHGLTSPTRSGVAPIETISFEARTPKPKVARLSHRPQTETPHSDGAAIARPAQLFPPADAPPEDEIESIPQPVPSVPVPASTFRSPVAARGRPSLAPGITPVPNFRPHRLRPAPSAQDEEEQRKQNTLRALEEAERIQKEKKKSNIFRLMLIIAVLGCAGFVVYYYVNPTVTFSFDKLPYFCSTVGAPRGQPQVEEKNCVACPNFGICAGGKLVSCKRGFIVSGGVKCVRDQEEVHTIEFLKEETHRILSFRNGAYQCGYSDIPSPALSEKDLKGQLKAKLREVGKSSWITEQGGAKFEENFVEMKKELTTLSQFNIRINDQVLGSEKVAYWSTDDATLPLSCAVYNAALEHIWQILGALLIIFFVSQFLWSRKKHARLSSEVEELVEDVKKLLIEYKTRHEQDSSNPAYLPVVHVRDTLIHDHPERKRKYAGDPNKVKEGMRIWKKVEQAIGGDRRVKTSPQMVDGQQQTVWEWVSKVPQVLSPRKAQSHS